MNESIIVKEYDFLKPDIHDIDYLLDDVIEDCRNKYFHTFEYRLVYDVKFPNISNNEEVNFTITHESTEIKTEFYGLNIKIRNARGNGFIFNQKNKLTIKIYTNLSNINIHYYLKLRIPICHRQFFKKLSQNPEYVKNFCTDLYNPFHFACRKRINQLN